MPPRHLSVQWGPPSFQKPFSIDQWMRSIKSSNAKITNREDLIRTYISTHHQASIKIGIVSNLVGRLYRPLPSKVKAWVGELGVWSIRVGVSISRCWSWIGVVGGIGLAAMASSAGKVSFRVFICGSSGPPLSVYVASYWDVRLGQLATLFSEYFRKWINRVKSIHSSELLS